MTKNIRKSILLLLAAVMTISLLSGCKKSAEEESSIPIVEESGEESSAVVEEASATEEVSEPEKTETEESSEESVEEVKEPEFTNPLTGEETDKDYTTQRPYVVMCNDIRQSMPQCGVSQADIIMEMMDESGVTRFMVWFMDPTGVEKIGSIRSARQYNVETAAGYDAFLVHCGGSTEALSTIYDTGLHDLDAIYGEYGTFWRDPDRQAYGIEHSMFANGTGIVTAITEIKEYDPAHPEGYDGTYGMSFSENAVDQCTETAESIHVAYAGWKTTDFTYDAEANAYTMYQYETEYTDDGEGGIPFANVIHMYADTYLQDDGCHLTIILNEGEGTFFTGGKAVAIKWYKDGWDDCFHFTLEDGTPLELSVGKTFICVNQTGGRDYEGTCSWE